MVHYIHSQFIHDTPDDHFLIADSAFPRTSVALKSKIRTQFKRNLPQDPGQWVAAITYGSTLVLAQQATEWDMRAIQGSFGRLRVPLNVNDPEGWMSLLELVVWIDSSPRTYSF